MNHVQRARPGNNKRTQLRQCCHITRESWVWMEQGCARRYLQVEVTWFDVIQVAKERRRLRLSTPAEQMKKAPALHLKVCTSYPRTVDISHRPQEGARACSLPVGGPEGSGAGSNPRTVTRNVKRGREEDVDCVELPSTLRPICVCFC